jgi:hypothetical protein
MDYASRNIDKGMAENRANVLCLTVRQLRCRNESGSGRESASLVMILSPDTKSYSPVSLLELFGVKVSALFVALGHCCLAGRQKRNRWFGRASSRPRPLHAARLPTVSQQD